MRVRTTKKLIVSHSCDRAFTRSASNLSPEHTETELEFMRTPGIDQNSIFSASYSAPSFHGTHVGSSTQQDTWLRLDLIEHLKIFIGY